MVTIMRCWFLASHVLTRMFVSVTALNLLFVVTMRHAGATVLLLGKTFLSSVGAACSDPFSGRNGWVLITAGTLAVENRFSTAGTFSSFARFKRIFCWHLGASVVGS